MSKTYHLFISHSWKYADQYDKLVNLLDERTYFKYANHSVPKDDPVHTDGTDSDLYDAIKSHMSGTHVVIILGGVYSSYSKWIKKEIKIAKKEFASPKPILAIKPRGSTSMSSVVKDAADDIVNWNTESVVDAIRELG